MKALLLLAALLPAGPLRAAEAPSRLIPAIGPALKSIRKGPAAIAARNLLALDPLLAQGRSGDHTRDILEPVLRTLDDKGFEGMSPKARRAALPRALASHAQSVDARADNLIAAAAKELEEGVNPDRSTFESAESHLVRSFPFLSEDRHRDLKDISSKDPEARAAFLERRRLVMAERLREEARKLVGQALPYWQKGEKAPRRFIAKDRTLDPENLPPGYFDRIQGPNLFGF